MNRFVMYPHTGDFTNPALSGHSVCKLPSQLGNTNFCSITGGLLVSSWINFFFFFFLHIHSTHNSALHLTTSHSVCHLNALQCFYQHWNENIFGKKWGFFFFFQSLNNLYQGFSPLLSCRSIRD